MINTLFKTPDSKLLQFFLNVYNTSLGRRDLFHNVIIETTTYCSRACSYCPNSVSERGKKKNEVRLPSDLYNKIIDDLSSINFKGRVLPHLYGEPLEDPRLPSFISYTKKKLPGAIIGIHTSGDLLNRDTFVMLVSSGVDFFLITEHKDFSSPEILELLRSPEVSKSSCKVVYRKLNQSDLMNRAGILKLNNLKKFKRCPLALNSIVVNAHGNTLLCCNDYHGEYVLGDTRSTTLENIWNDIKYQKLRKDLRSGIFRNEICLKCTQ